MGLLLCREDACGWNVLQSRSECTQRNLIKLNRNKIIFTIYLLIWNQTDTVRLLFQINRKMVNTIWFPFDLIRFRKDFSVCEIKVWGNGKILYLPLRGEINCCIFWIWIKIRIAITYFWLRLGVASNRIPFDAKLGGKL